MNLQQVDLKTQTVVSILRNVASITKTDYQGTNVGQNLSVLSGVKVVANNGIDLYTYVGYVDHHLPGFITKTNILTANHTGMKTETGITFRNGTNIQMDIASRGRQRNFSVYLPIGRRLSWSRPVAVARAHSRVFLRCCPEPFFTPSLFMSLPLPRG